MAARDTVESHLQLSLDDAMAARAALEAAQQQQQQQQEQQPQERRWSTRWKRS